MRSALLVLSYCLFSLISNAQVEIRGRVTDRESAEPLAFVAISEKGTGNGTYSDIDGFFNIRVESAQSLVTFTYIGYETLITEANAHSAWEVKLSPVGHQLDEVVILPGVNPAERIMKAAISLRSENNPEGNVTFMYDSYNKLVITADIDSVLLVDTLAYREKGVSDRKIIDYFRKQHLFLMESVSRRKYMPPNHSEETIIASKVSGLKNPEFALLASQLQSFSFYTQEVQILDVEYVSPLANDAIDKYLFIIEDTTFIDQDSVYTISFRPRKGKNFDGLKGQLFIHTHGYAIKNVIAEPNETVSNFEIRIQQQYQLTPHGWFPEQFNSFFGFPGSKIGEWETKGIARSYIDHIQFEIPMENREFTPVSLLMQKGALTVPDSVWKTYRIRPLDNRELNTYHTIDSIGRAENFDKKLQVIGMMTTGKLPFGKISLDMQRLFRYNDYEGWRLGAGFHTNDFLSKAFSIGGYYAYGFRDRAHKFGGDAQFNLYQKRDVEVHFIYENDVIETGGRQVQKSVSGLINGNIYPLFVSRMDRYEKKEVQISGRALGNLNLTFFGNSQFVQPFKGIDFVSTTSDAVNLFKGDFFTTELGAQFRFAPGEKLALMGQKEIRLGGRFPVFYWKYSRGIEGLLKGEFDYNRYDASVEKVFRLRNIGEFSVNVLAGMVQGNIPLSLNYNMHGSWRKFTVAAPGSFETMRTNEFQNSRFIEVHLRHNFRDLLFKTDFFAPHLSLVHNMAWGQLDNPLRYTISAKGIPLGFYESGIQLDRLIKSTFSSFGIGVFYRYGPYHLPTQNQNFAIKITSSIGS